MGRGLPKMITKSDKRGERVTQYTVVTYFAFILVKYCISSCLQTIKTVSVSPFLCFSEYQKCAIDLSLNGCLLPFSLRGGHDVTKNRPSSWVFTRKLCILCQRVELPSEILQNTFQYFAEHLSIFLQSSSRISSEHLSLFLKNTII